MKFRPNEAAMKRRCYGDKGIKEKMHSRDAALEIQ